MRLYIIWCALYVSFHHSPLLSSISPLFLLNLYYYIRDGMDINARIVRDLRSELNICIPPQHILNDLRTYVFVICRWTVWRSMSPTISIFILLYLLLFIYFFVLIVSLRQGGGWNWGLTFKCKISDWRGMDTSSWHCMYLSLLTPSIFYLLLFLF